MDLEKLKDLRRNLLLLSLLELIAGLFMIIMNDKSLEIVIVVLGVIAASYSIVNFFAWLIKRNEEHKTSAIVILLFGIISGGLLVLFRDKLLDYFVLIVGILAGIFGVIKIPNMVSIKKSGFKKWWIVLILIFLIVGIGIIVGLISFNNAIPDDAKRNSAASILLGIALALGCAADIFAMAGTSSVQKDLAALEVEAEAAIEEESSDSGVDLGKKKKDKK